MIIFGAGNIGRSFLTPVFLDAGYDVTLVDIDAQLIRALGEQGRYTIEVRSAEGVETRVVSGFDAVELSDREEIVDLVADTDLVATAVGQRGLPGVCDLLAEALPERRLRHGVRPLDVILAENFRAGREFCRLRIASHLAADFPLEEMLGIVETSIGKMVPVVSEEQRRADPLRLYAEPYNTLILDRNAFRGAPPEGPGIELVSPIEAYVDRKLFVHNLGHAAAAYHGRARHPEREYVWEVLEDDAVAAAARDAMMQGAAAVRAEYPGAFSREALGEHVEDLIHRFANRNLRDTVERVGRDLRRKLSRDDRLTGAMRLAAAHGLPFEAIAAAYRAALGFGALARGADGPASVEEADREISMLFKGDPERAYRELSTANEEPDELDRRVLAVITGG